MYLSNLAHVFVKIQSSCSKLSLLLAFNILLSAKQNYVFMTMMRVPSDRLI